MKLNYKPSRTFNKEGKWMHKPTHTDILICTCGNKYLKTRENQKTCVKCMYVKS